MAVLRLKRRNERYRQVVALMLMTVLSNVGRKDRLNVRMEVGSCDWDSKHVVLLLPSQPISHGFFVGLLTFAS